MITRDGFNVGLVILKATFNLKDFERDTIGVWFTLLEETDIDDRMFLRAIKRVSTYEENWFTVGSNFVGKVMKAVVNIREEDREAARYRGKEPPKQLDYDPLEDNAEFNEGMKEFSAAMGKGDKIAMKRAIEKQEKAIERAKTEKTLNKMSEQFKEE